MNRQLYRGILLCGLLGCMACTPDSEPPQPTTPDYSAYPHQLTARGDTLVYRWLTRAAHFSNPDEYSQRDSTSIELYFPQLDSIGAVSDTINRAIKRLLLRETQDYTTVEARLDGFIEEFKIHREDMIAFGLPSSNWSFTMTIDVLLNNPQVFALRIQQLEYTGGAHANAWISYQNYNPQNGQLLTLDALLHDSTYDSFEQLAQRAFVQALQDSTLSEPLTLLDSSAFALPELFGIEKLGMRFYYRPYDLGSFASEGLSFFLSYQELLPVLDTNRLKVVPIL